MSTILIVDDDPVTRTVLTALLENAAFSVLACAHGEDALKMLQNQPADLVITDLVMEPGMDGIELLRRVKSEYTMPVALMTGYDSVEVAVQAMREGAFDFLRKPIKPSDLLLVVKAALQKENAGPEDHAVFVSQAPAPPRFGLLHGESPAMQKLYRQISLLSKTEVPILVTGEAGTEKADVMQVLYQQSRRSSGPLFVVDFATHAPESFDAVLGDEYCVVPGATGKAAKQRTPETVALRNVHLLPTHLQEELAAFVKQKRSPFHTDGTGLPADVRFLAATHKSLTDLAETGAFNSDAAIFLSMVTTHVPPLRERLQDVAQLAQKYLLDKGNESSRHLPITLGAMQLLGQYPWPGNIEELHRVLDKAMDQAQNNIVTIHDISPHLSGHLPEPATSPKLRSGRRGALAREYLKEQEKKYKKLLQEMQDSDNSAAV
jgi:two-component system response regulator AtoC